MVNRLPRTITEDAIPSSQVRSRKRAGTIAGWEQSQDQRLKRAEIDDRPRQNGGYRLQCMLVSPCW